MSDSATSSPIPDLTSAELEVMKVLWAHQPLSAREVHQALADQQDWAYSTSRTILDRLASKKTIQRKKFHGLWLYETQVSRPRGLAAFVRRFAERILEVPVPQVISLFVEHGRLTPEEVEELRSILDEPES